MINIGQLPDSYREHLEQTVNDFSVSKIDINEAATALNSKLEAELLEDAARRCTGCSFTPAKHRELATRVLAVALMTRGEERKYGNTLRYHGMNCRDLGRYEQAVDALETSVAILEECSAPDDAAISLIHLGHIHRDHGWHSEAIRAYEDTIRLTDEQNSRDLFGSAHLWMADCLDREGQVEQAAQSFRTAAAILDSDDEPLEWLAGLAWLGCALTEKRITPESDLTFLIRKAQANLDLVLESDLTDNEHKVLLTVIRDWASREPSVQRALLSLTPLP